jgi:hypothetical protein
MEGSDHFGLSHQSAVPDLCNHRWPVFASFIVKIGSRQLQYLPEQRQTLTEGEVPTLTQVLVSLILT